MPGKKKKFIDKKNAVSFHLVHRSQKDPLQADEDAPQRVLLPLGGGTDSEKAAHKEEERKFGVFYDDDYDYLQHLRDVDELYEVEPAEGFQLVSNTPQAPGEQAESGTLNLPSSVFASETETDVGLLNKAAPVSGPRLDFDPDIVAALDEDFDFEDPENQLEDDFIIKANDASDLPEGHGVEQYAEQDSSDNETDTFKPCSFRPKIEVVDGESSEGDDSEAEDDGGSSDDDVSDVGSLGDRSYDDMDTKSRFTSYSMTSSVVRRSAGLTLLDDRFEKVYEQYDDEEIGALDHEDIEGYVKQNSQILNAAIDEFEKLKDHKKLKDAILSGRGLVETVECGSDNDEDNDEDIVKMTIRQPQEKWDCESILSTHSTLYNHPTKISEPKKPRAIKLTKRAELPADVLPTRGLTLKQIERSETRPDAGDRVNTYRPKSETSDERKQRKSAVKDERRMRREEKKSNKLAFKQEKIRQEKEHLNLQQNTVGSAIT